jgi:hypothetical protein
VSHTFDRQFQNSFILVRAKTFIQTFYLRYTKQERSTCEHRGKEFKQKNCLKFLVSNHCHIVTCTLPFLALRASKIVQDQDFVLLSYSQIKTERPCGCS